jgi:hypothetical protein
MHFQLGTLQPVDRWWKRWFIAIGKAVAEGVPIGNELTLLTPLFYVSVTGTQIVLTAIRKAKPEPGLFRWRHVQVWVRATNQSINDAIRIGDETGVY